MQRIPVTGWWTDGSKGGSRKPRRITTALIDRILAERYAKFRDESANPLKNADLVLKEDENEPMVWGLDELPGLQWAALQVAIYDHPAYDPTSEQAWLFRLNRKRGQAAFINFSTQPTVSDAPAAISHGESSLEELVEGLADLVTGTAEISQAHIKELYEDGRKAAAAQDELRDRYEKLVWKNAKLRNRFLKQRVKQLEMEQEEKAGFFGVVDNQLNRLDDETLKMGFTIFTTKLAEVVDALLQK